MSRSLTHPPGRRNSGMMTSRGRVHQITKEKHGCTSSVTALLCTLAIPPILPDLPIRRLRLVFNAGLAQERARHRDHATCNRLLFYQDHRRCALAHLADTRLRRCGFERFRGRRSRRCRCHRRCGRCRCGPSLQHWFCCYTKNRCQLMVRLGLLMTTRILRTQHETESTHRPAGPPPPATPPRICFLPTGSRAGRRSPLCLSCPSSSACSKVRTPFDKKKAISPNAQSASRGGIVTARMP